jgi:hypothetical protein
LNALLRYFRVYIHRGMTAARRYLRWLYLWGRLQKSSRPIFDACALSCNL